MGATRRVLERVPDADLRWKPHEKSFSLGQLALHVANLPYWATITCDTSEFDPADAPRPGEPVSAAEVLATFDRHVADARARLAGQTDAALLAPWTLKQDGQDVFTMPKASILRTFVMNHMIHHRGQLTVYLRLRNVPLPSLYGPTADEG
jgi:uncharacterized damage-inducible protein DinB